MAMKQTIAIIGNGDMADGVAAVIDACDLVIRFNDCRSVGKGGSKTDIVAVCNTGRPARTMMEGEAWKAKPAVMQASAIWLVRDPAKFAALRAPLRVSHPELEDFCDDYSNEYRIFANSTGKELHIIPGVTHDAVDAALVAFEPEPYVVPSSGLIVIQEVIRNTAGNKPDIVIAGFGHQGWTGHPFAAERRMVDRLASDGLLRRLPAAAFNPLLQGV